MMDDSDGEAGNSAPMIKGFPASRAEMAALNAVIERRGGYKNLIEHMTKNNPLFDWLNKRRGKAND
jgi:hypothetical protein